MNLVFGHDQAVAEWMSSRMQCQINPPYTAIGIIDGAGTLRGGAAFNDYTGSNLEIHIYGPGLLKRGVIRGVYHYAFVQCGVLRLSAKLKRKHPLLKIIPRMGFKYEATLKNYFGLNNDAIMFRLDAAAAMKWM